MVAPKKQNTTMDMVSNTKEVKVKEEERDNLVNDKVSGKKMEMNQKREEDNNKKDKEKKKAPKPKVAKYKKNKGKNRRDKEKERGEECQREMDERIKEQEHNERVDKEKEKKDKEEEQKKRKGKEREEEKAKKDIEEEKRKMKEKERKEDWPREMEKEQRERVDKEKAKKDNEEEQKKRKEKELHEDRKRKGEQNERNKKEREEWQRETEEKEQMEIVDKEKAKKDKEEKKRKRSEEGQEKEVHNDRERKEEMELEVEEDEQNERNGNEEPTKSVFPNFFKVVMPGHCTEQVEIPSSLNGYLENESPGVVSLRGPSGNTWRVELAANSRGLHLAHGWKEFFNDHRIQLEYFLVFLYEGQSQFSVRVFDKSGCEAHDAFLARPCNDTVTNDDGGMITNVDGMDPQEEHIGHVAAENDGGDMGTNVGGTDQLEEDACSLAEEDKEDMDTNVGDTNPQEEDTGGEEPECSEEEEDERHMGSNDASDTSEKNDQDDNANSAPDTSQDDGVYHGLNTRKKRFRKIDGILAEDDRRASKKRKVMGKRCVASPHSSASKIIASGATMKVPDTTNISKSIVPRPPRFHCTLFNKSNNVPQPGEVLTKVQRRPALISQRRPVTEEEKSDALERAMRFRSPRPFTHKALTYSEVYTTYFMVIPHEFVQKYLPKHSRKMTLWDPQAKPWEVSYVYWEWDSCSSGAAFSAGWGAFAAYNNLEKSDVCVFEILDDDDHDKYSIKVHIHRVVLEITPCIDPLCEGN